MREIKFRAWDGSMHYFSLFAVPMEFRGRLKESPVMQFTGLKDKNGKEIYEGDCFAWGVHRCEIVWDKDGFGAKNEQGLVLGLSAIAGAGEIIGNIYENPELLTTK